MRRGAARLLTASRLTAFLAGAGCAGPPEAGLGAAPAGVEVSPSPGPIPENLLRFYLRFPAPMRRGDAAAQIALIGPDGAPVEAAFLQIGQELWSADLRTLTLIVDPGRLKLGVEPNRTLGPPLRAGQAVALRIGEGMRDATGAAQPAPILVSYTVVEADRAGPEPGRWRLSAPTAGSLDPLRVAPDAPVDPVQAPRFLRVQGADGAPIPGAWQVEGDGQALRFTPASPWRAGDCSLAVHPRLEDMAGNRVGARFDLDPGTVQGLPKGDGEPALIPFRVRGPGGEAGGEG